jgi:hypothetical protein
VPAAVQTGQLSLGPFVVGRVRGHRRHRRTHEERHGETEQDKEYATEHRAAEYQNFSALSCTPQSMSMEKYFLLQSSEKFF